LYLVVIKCLTSQRCWCFSI